MAAELAMGANAQQLEARRLALEAELGEAITCDGLTRDFRIFQRRRGHRHSTDDLLTAWYAATTAQQEPARVLDLGTGIGSVALSLAWLFLRAVLTAVERQPMSFRLLRENLLANGLEQRVAAHLGDLRALRELVADERYELVTGTPPYFDVKDGIVSADSQRAAARFELAGDVHDYCRAARAVLAEGGRFVFCFPTAQHERALAACSGAGLSVLSFRDVVPRQGLDALFTLYAAQALETIAPPPAASEPFVVRDEAGAHTAELTAARALFGLVR